MLVFVSVKRQLRRRVVVMAIHLFTSNMLWIAFDPFNKFRPTNTHNSLAIYTVSQKYLHNFSFEYLRQKSTDFNNFYAQNSEQIMLLIFDIRNPVLIMHIRSANFPPHLKTVTTLPCKT